MLKKLLNGKTKTITSAAIIVGAASLTSRLLGVLRDRVLAGEFGAGSQLDIYYASFRIPDFLYIISLSVASITVLVPFFLEKTTQCLK